MKNKIIQKYVSKILFLALFIINACDKKTTIDKNISDTKKGQDPVVEKVENASKKSNEIDSIQTSIDNYLDYTKQKYKKTKRELDPSYREKLSDEDYDAVKNTDLREKLSDEDYDAVKNTDLREKLSDEDYDAVKESSSKEQISNQAYDEIKNSNPAKNISNINLNKTKLSTTKTPSSNIYDRLSGSKIILKNKSLSDSLNNNQ